MSPPARSLATEAVRGSLWTLSGTIVAIPLGLASVAVAARYLHAGGFGRYTLYSFVIPLGLAALDLGMGSQFHWAATSGRAAGSKEAKNAIQGTLTWNMIKVPLVIGGSFILFSGHVGAACLLAGVLAMSLLTEAVATSLSADRNFRAMSQSATLGNIGSSIAVVVAAITTASAEWTAAAFYVSRLIALPYLFASAAPDLRRASITPGPVRLDRTGVSFGLSSYVASLLQTWVFGRSELVFLSRYSTPVATGQFGLVTTVAQRATLMADALYGSIGISFIALQQTGADRMALGVSRALRVASSLAVSSALLGLPAVSLFATPVFGPHYGDLVFPAGVLFAIALCRTASLPISSLVFARRAARATIIPGLLAALIDGGLSLALIPPYGFAGAVIANASASITFIICTSALARLTREVWATYLTGMARLAIATVPAVIFANAGLPGSVAVRAALATLANLGLWLLTTRLLPPVLRVDDAQAIVAALPSALRIVVRVPMAILTLGRDSRSARTS